MKAKAKKKARITTVHDENPSEWKAWGCSRGANVLVLVGLQPTRKRAIAMARAALEAGGYAIEEEG
jgi:hypothetical protein